MLFAIAYVLAVVLVNIGFSYVPLWHTPIGTVAPMAIFVGAIFVLRDYAQVRIGDMVLVAMGVAVVASYVLADPNVAVASAIAFAASELIDYVIYTATERPFKDRVLLSSIVSTPFDTAIFLWGIGHFGWGTFLFMTLSKLIAAVVVWFAYRRRPQEEPLIRADGTGSRMDRP